MKMSEPGKRRGEITREAILMAAESVFAQHGFDGARIDTIADISGYNKTLIFRYFGDKLGLYAEVLKRADRETAELQARILMPLLQDETLVSDAHRFRVFLKAALSSFFEYLVEHPHLMRILVWEHAEGWQTLIKIVSQFDRGDIARIEAIFARIQQAGLLRSDFDPVILLVLAEQVCWSYPTSLPFYQMIFPERDFSSAQALARARASIIEFLVAGLLADPQDAES
jgi:TetR/AcrR family transcriptional regulator